MASMETLSREMKKDIQLIGKFVEVYCSGKHPEMEKSSFMLPENTGRRRICAECARFMSYAVERRLKCPLEAEKPSCKKCRIHCYAGEQRAKVKEIMAYSGRRLMMRGRVDYLWHYFF